MFIKASEITVSFTTLKPWMWASAVKWKLFLYIINWYILPAVNRVSQQRLFSLTSQIIVTSEAINVVRYPVSIVAAAASGISMRNLSDSLVACCRRFMLYFCRCCPLKNVVNQAMKNTDSTKYRCDPKTENQHRDCWILTIRQDRVEIRRLLIN